MALATRAEVKSALGITDTNSDDQIDALLAPISALIELEAGRKFSPQEFTERHRGGEATIILGQYPIESGSPGVTVVDKITGETMAADQYEIDYDKGMLRRLPLGTQWATGSLGQTVYLQEDAPVDRWQVSYTAATTPEDIKMAFYMTVGASLDASATGSGGMGDIIAESDGDYSYRRGSANSASNSLVSSIPPKAAAIVRRYQAGVFI